MEYLFFIGFLASLLIFSALAFCFAKYSRKKNLEKEVMQIFFIGLAQLVISALSFLWSFGFLSYSEKDFLIIYSLILLMQGFFFFLIIYNLSKKNNSLFYFLFFYLLIFIVMIVVHVSFLNIFIISFFLFVLLLSVNLLFRNDDYRDLGVLGVFYSGISIPVQIMVIFGLLNLYVSSIVYSVLFSALLVILVRFLKKNPVPVSRRLKKKKSYAFTFLRDFIFMISLISFVFIGTVVIHELGHLLVSYFYHCVSREIVYAGGFPDTQIFCTNLSSHLWVTLGGVLLPIVLGLALMFVGGKFLREIGLLMIGFNLIIASGDFSNLGLSGNFAIFLVIVGIILAVAGIATLARSKAEEYLYSAKPHE